MLFVLVVLDQRDTILARAVEDAAMRVVAIGKADTAPDCRIVQIMVR